MPQAPSSQPTAALARMPTASVRVLVGFGAVLLVSLVILHRRPARTVVGGGPAPDPAARFLSLSEGANATIAADLRALTAGPHLHWPLPDFHYLSKIHKIIHKISISSR
ncbi:hypothetical protein E2562_036768 [Oryza meyeriana var. granulata]|uniref:Uncharacterized protein n=1 Tax=Oryza meyeriana var. granulata TaxID=110450 RepID=A0A6G1DRX1_9ORYZ|nr:hypothetical protein E2562_036768 [Oryza meyeriana var. granulata]